MITRAGVFIANRVRSLFPRGASEALITRTEEALESRGPFRAGDRVAVGPSDRQIHLSRLAIGTGSGGWSGSSNQTRKLGIEGLSRLFLHGLHEHGINFWESADEYGSHPHLKEALRQVRREDVILLTKTVATSAAAMRRDLDRFRRELGTDIIDILLLHCMTAADWPRRMAGVMEVISEAQQSGIVKLKGVSCHSFAALEAAACERWVEVDLARINPGGPEMDASPDRVVSVLDRMKQARKSVIGMKVFGNAALLSRKEECLRFVLGLLSVDCFTIGFESTRELDEVVELIARV